MQHTPYRPPAGVLIALSAVILLLAIAVLGWLWQQWLVLDTALPMLTLALRIAFFTVPPAYALAFVWQRWGRTRYIDAHHITQQLRAKHQHAPPARVIEGELVSAPALMAPVIKPLDTWLQWIDEQPHALLSGRTKAGKTHTATAILARRLRAGETVYIVDPHSSGWLGLPTVGFVGMLEDGKPDTTALNAALMAVAAEYIRRMRARDDQKNASGTELPHDHWPRLTVLIDEANYIADVLPTVWREFIKALASGGRKVGISLLVLGQSPLVEDLGVSGSMRGNFARLGLDDRTVQQLIGTDEKDSERKKALHAALSGMERPAAATIDAQVWLLDRRTLSAGSAPTNARALVWSGNERSIAVTSPGADSSTSSTVPTAAEIAAIAVALRSGTPSEVAKKLDGYHPRKYTDYKAKVEYVQALLKGER